jgi:hypothetical protein
VDGSSTLGPGSASPSVQSLSESWPAGVWLNETYVFSGACLKRVAVLIAVMICRVTQSSAKLRNDVSLSARKSRTALYEAGVAADQEIERRRIPVSRPHDQLKILKLSLSLLSGLSGGHGTGSHGSLRGICGRFPNGCLVHSAEDSP